MKKYFNIKTIFILISILIIIAGAVSLYMLGFETSMEYQAGTRIEVYIPSGYEKDEILDIAKESFNTEKLIFSEVDKVNQVAGIKVMGYSKEELDTYINKIAEKYKMDKNKIEYYEMVVPETKISTVMKPYMMPVLLITVLALIYIIIRNYKSDNKIRISLRVLEILVITLCLYFSIIALFRLQFSIYTMPIALAIYIVTLLIAVNKKCK